MVRSLDAPTRTAALLTLFWANQLATTNGAGYSSVGTNYDPVGVRVFRCPAPARCSNSLGVSCGIATQAFTTSLGVALPCFVIHQQRAGLAIRR